MSKPIVAIVGRPNVGKSTLFNRLAGQRMAIVEDQPGVTRDRLYIDAEWLNRHFTIVDTGGIEPDPQDELLAAMRRQAELAIDEADVILFVVDAKQGVTGADQEVAKMLRTTKKPVVLAVNKVDNREMEATQYEFFSLGLGDPLTISAVHGLGTGDLLDEVVKSLPADAGEDYDEDVIKVAIIGRPNVGKSSLANALLGQERMIVSDVAGTTRDAIDSMLNLSDGTRMVIIDTAGMRRKAKIDLPVERYSVIRALRAVDRSDVVLMVLDALQGVTEQDKKIVGYAHENGKASIIVVNKWDLVEKDEKTANLYTNTIRHQLAFLQYAPIIFISAKTRQRVHRIGELVKYVAEQHAMRIATGVLNSLVEEATMINPPPSDKGKRLKIYFATQPSVKPPTFVFFVNHAELMHFSYLRYLENKLRESFGFEGTPLRMVVRERDEK
ncbi:MAG TPA: ribosome biogenesis GTPase Der [Firmicutes bacterium]|nr:ribosome biogenesis GTPase Der [Bacillota bacterium]HWR56101.1 ribosome biogenesis GTPase Der [Negativicutes bacterium]